MDESGGESSSVSGAEVTGEATTTAGETGGETGGGGLCGGSGSRFSASLVPLDTPDVPDCGTIELQVNVLPSMELGVFELDACGCEQNCESPIPWRLTIDAPTAVMTDALPFCSRVVFERQWNAAHTECEFLALSVFNDVLSTPFGVYHAATRAAPTALAVERGWEVTVSDNETCACDECCRTPKLLDLTFGFGGMVLVQLTEGHDSAADLTGEPFHFFDLQSHDAGLCDEADEIDWVIRSELK